jgi:small subunit ribosomal protein S18
MYSHKFATRTIQKGRAPKLGPGAREARRHDVFAQLDIDPLREVGNRRLLSRFVSEMGKIKPRQETKLSRKSQHRLGKAIRRSKMMGLIPVLRKPMWSKNYFEF